MSDTDEIPVHPILQYYPEVGNSPELDFATGVVNYIMRFYIPFWRHPLTPANGSVQFTTPIRMVIRHFHIKNEEVHRNRFDEVFRAYDMTTDKNYELFLINEIASFNAEPYSHVRFLKFCTEMSTYSAYMYREDRTIPPEYAVLAVILAVWPIRFYWNQDDVPFDQHWKYLDQFCSMVKEGELVHPILEYYPKTENSPELHFAIDVVNYIVRFHFPNWKHPLREEIASDLFTPSIRMAIDDLRFRLGNSYRNHFNQVFYNDDLKTDLNYSIFMEDVMKIFGEEPYNHERFLGFCTQISMYAVFMFREDNPAPPDFAVLCIVLALWPNRFYWDQDEVPIDVHWKHLDRFCKKLEESKENQLWRRNV